MDIRLFARKYFAELQDCCEKLDLFQLELAKDIFLSAYRAKKKIFLAGNGGSAATAAHMMCDFNKGILGSNGESDIVGFRTFCLVNNIPELTAWSNDVGYERIFVEQVKNFYDEGDIILAISASGNSSNVILACEYVKSRGGKIIGFAGFSGGKLKEIADACVVAQVGSYEIAEDVHAILMHILKNYFIATLKHDRVNRGLKEELTEKVKVSKTLS